MINTDKKEMCQDWGGGAGGRGSPLVRGQRGKKEPAKETEGTAREVGREPGE